MLYECQFSIHKKTSKRNETTWLKYDIHVKLQSQMINQNLVYSPVLKYQPPNFISTNF